MEGVFSVNIVAFLFALIGAALNMFLSVIRTPVPGSTFTGSMYDAVRSVMTNGLPDEGGTVLAILILLVLFLVPVSAAVSGLFIPFSKSKRSGIILCLCALVNALAAWGIYYLSSEIFVSPFLSNYVVPYAQKVSFITPAIWAAFYLIAGILVLIGPDGENPVPYKIISGPSIVFGIGWTKKKGVLCDLDASAFLFGANNKPSGLLYFNTPEDKLGALVYGPYMWSTGDVKEGNSKPSSDDLDLEQIMVLLNDVPSDIHKIVFTVTAHIGRFEHASSAHARLVEGVELSEEHCENKTLRVDNTAGTEVKRTSLKKNEEDEKMADGFIFAAIHRRNIGRGWNKKKGWVLEEKLQFKKGGFKAVCQELGVEVDDLS